jgi:hypothetical protein
MYKSEEAYAQVIKLLYGAKTHGIKQHRQIYNTKLFENKVILINDKKIIKQTFFF